MRRPVHRLSTFITASLIGLSALPMLGLSVAAGLLLVGGLQKNNEAVTTSLVTSLALAGGRAIEPAGNILRSMEIIQAEGATLPEIRRFMEATRLSRPNIEAIAFLDAAGRVVELSPHDDKRLRDDLSGQPGFSRARAEGPTVYSPPFISSLDRQVTVACYRNFGKFTGLVLINLSSLAGQIDQVRISSKDDTAIIDGAGRIIAHSHMEYVYEQRYALQPAAEGLVERIAIDGSPRLAVSKAIPGVGWRAIYYRDLAESELLLDSLLASLVLAAFLALSIAVVLALTIRGMIQKPFALILAQLGGFTAGHYDRRVEGSFLSELDAVARAVNTMADKVELRDTELQRSEERYRALFFGGEVPALLISSRDGAITDLNHASCAFYGWSREELLAMRIWDINTQSEARVREALAQVAETGGRKFVFRHRRKDGSIRDVESFSTKIEIDGVDYAYALIFDVTERIRAEEQVKRDLAEKTVLLKEVHHRVKNNLQIISSLFYLQAETISEAKPRSLLKTSEDRIFAMSLAHEIIYQSPNLSSIDMGNYIEQLLSWLASSHPVEGLVAETSFEELLLPLDKALSLGLLINELVTNALLHGMGKGKEKRIFARIRRLAEDGKPALACLEIEDRGPGLPSGFSGETATSLGLSLARSLAQQLNGGIEWLRLDEVDRDGGVAVGSGKGLLVRVIFPSS